MSSNNFDSAALIKKLEFYYDNAQNVMLTGGKGIGKTSIIKDVFERKSKKWLYFSGATMDPWVDFIGVPKEKETKDGSVLEFIRPAYMSDDIEAIFIDEFNRSLKKVKDATMELIQFKSINGKKFPKLKVVWVGMNPYNPDDEDNEIYNVEPLDPAQQDRFQVQIDLPYMIDQNYFESKYGKPMAEGACEWWRALPAKIKLKVSPRRLDYALQMHLMSGDVRDVIPFESNPSKLIESLKIGGVEKQIKKVFDAKDTETAKSMFNSENFFQACASLITANAALAKFFVPLLDRERQIALFVGKKSFQDIVFKDMVAYHSLLEELEHNKMLEPVLLDKVTRALKKMNGISLDDFNDSTSALSGSFNIATGVAIGPVTASGVSLPVSTSDALKGFWKNMTTGSNRNDLVVNDEEEPF